MLEYIIRMVITMKTKNIPVKNYIILVILTILTFVLLFYLASYYQKRKEYESSIDTRMNFLSEVKENELEHYILENDDVLIYISDSTDTKYRTFEKQLKTLMVGEDLTKDVIYMDMYKVSKQFSNHIKHDLAAETLQLENLVYPNVLTISSGKITSVLYYVEQEKSPVDVIYYIKGHLQEQ